MALKSDMIGLQNEDQLQNIFYHTRSQNTAVFEMSVKAISTIFELECKKADEYIENLIRFYHTEMVKVRQLDLEAL